MNKKVSMAPFAVASDGTVYVNVAHFKGDAAVTKILRQARRLDGMLFIGVAVTRHEEKTLARAVDHAGTEAVARMSGPRQRRKRRSQRSSARPR